jgi:hypothetical protein
MRYVIKDHEGTVINVVVADEDFVQTLCEENGWAYAPDAAQDEEPVEVDEQIITVPAWLRRFDWLCDTPKQAALACSNSPIARGMMQLALSRVNEGISLRSQSLQGMLLKLVEDNAITSQEATKLRTTPPRDDERFVK